MGYASSVHGDPEGVHHETNTGRPSAQRGDRLRGSRMTDNGSEVTASFDGMKEFHQCPNVIRDLYLSKIGVDGYGYVNYLLSWANSRRKLSQRRQMDDLRIAQGRLTRIQGVVLKHCPFITYTPGNSVTSNRWHIDLGAVWRENTLAAAARILASGGVSKTDTPCIQNGYAPVSKMDTLETKGNKTKKDRKDMSSDDDVPVDPGFKEWGFEQRVNTSREDTKAGSKARRLSDATTAENVPPGAQVFADAWNANRGTLPAVAKLTAARSKAVERLIADLGDDALPMLIDATKAVAANDYWTKNAYGFDNLLRDKVAPYAEKYRATRATAGDESPMNRRSFE